MIDKNLKTLRTFDQVEKALGGMHAVAKLTKRSPQSVCNWRDRGFFPTVLVDKIQYSLERMGFRADVGLFRIEKVEAA